MTDPEEARWLLECRQARNEEGHLLAQRERRWQADHPLEWAAWLKTQPLLFPLFGRPDYGFEDFLGEVGKAPSASSTIVRKDDTLPFRATNICWDYQYAPSAASPYLNAGEAAAYLKMSLSTFYKNSRYIIRQPGVGKLLYLREDLDAFAAERKHRRR